MGEIVALDKTYVAGTYNRFPVQLVRGEGSYAWDEEGKRYIDLGSGIAVNSFGFCDTVWQEAVTRQLSTLQHTSNLYYTAPCARLAEMLCRRTGMKKVFFSNSGAEANECAIKVARKYAAEKKGSEYFTIVTLQNSFHGRTLTTLAATGQEHYHELFQPLTPGFVHVPANDVAAMEEAVATHKVAGILLECVQGEGGVIALDGDYLRAVEAIARREDVVLMIDEVQTGNGRSGSLYAYMHAGITPDVVTTAKGLGAGLPIGAALLGERVENVLGFGDHGSTFGGNPVACAGALSVLERLDEAFLATVKEKSAYIFEQLTGAKGIKSVTGLGLMIGIETQKPAAEVVKACMEQGVLCVTAKHKVRLLPALNIPMEALAEAISVIKRVCAQQE